MTRCAHQYIDRTTRTIQTETLLADDTIAWMYDRMRERSGPLFRALTSSRCSRLLGWLQYDLSRSMPLARLERFIRSMKIDRKEFVRDMESMHTLREIFERQIRYWDSRPMCDAQDVVVSPSDARMLVGSFSETSGLSIKDKFFDFDELLGLAHPQWRSIFRGGDFAVFRLTPEKYHYNHTPVSGFVADIYELAGQYHSCNPSATVQMVTPLSKNRRSVTILDTDGFNGTGVGFVAMIEIAALMIGDIVQCYSDVRYEAPKPVKVGMTVKKGQPKSLFRPGSSTTVLIFEKNRIRFSSDLRENRFRQDVCSRYSLGFDMSLVETDVQVRSKIGCRARAVNRKS
ncbi:MAG: phosphatidylserine decarboxylase [Desulfatirhabdiaceae bacterium]